MSQGKKMTFKEKLEQSSRPKEEPKSQLESNVNKGLDRTTDAKQLYKFQTPSNYDFQQIGSTTVHRDTAVADDRDVELLRMIQKSTRKPRYNNNADVAAPNDEHIINSLQTDEDVISFFSSYGSTSSVKYVLLNRAPKTLEFRPYDLVVVPKGKEESEHYIMSATGVVHVLPGNPSDVVSLAEWMKESSLYNILRKIPFFKNFLLYKAFFRLYQKLRAKQYANTRKQLAKDLLISKATFSTPCFDILKTSYDLSKTPLIAYLPHGKHDYSVDDFRSQQNQQRHQAVSNFTDITEKVEGKVSSFVDLLQRRADVPDLNTREALEQYLLTNSKAPGNSRAQKVKSMLNAREEQEQRMQELKRSIVEYSKLDIYIRLVDVITSEYVFQNALSTVQSLLNTLRSQGHDEFRKIGFQVLLHPTDTLMEYNPPEEALCQAWDDVVNGCFDAVSSLNHLCYQKFLKAYFSKAPKVWNIGNELKNDARTTYINNSIVSLVHQDYELANARMETYSTTLPHIHFLLNDWTTIEQGWKEQANEETLSALTLSKVYRRIQEAHDALRVLMASFVGHILWINAGKLKTEIEPRIHVIKDGVNATLRKTTLALVRELNTYYKQKTQLLKNKPLLLMDFAEYVSNYKDILASSHEMDAVLAQTEALCDLMDRNQVEFLEDSEKQLKERTLGSMGANSTSLHEAFDEARAAAEEYVEENMPTHVEALRGEVNNVEDECAGLQQIMAGEEFVELSENTEPVMQYLDDINTKLNDVKASEEQLTRFAALFDQPPIDWTCVQQTTTLYEMRRESWTLFSTFNEKIDYWFESPLKQLNTLEMEDEVNAMVRKAAAIHRTALDKEYDDEVTPHLLEELQAIRLNMNVIHDCGNKHMTPARWNIVLKQVLGTGNAYHDGLNLRALQERDIFNHKEILAEQSGLATGEWKISNDLEAIKQVWDNVLFTTKPYKSREGVYILGELEEVIQQLEDHQVELQTIMASRFVAPVRDKVEVWVKDLRLVSDVIDEWITLQRNWMYLEFIFSSDDIKEQLATESKQFDDVDRLFRTLTNKANTVKRVFEICTTEGLYDDIKQANESIDHIQKKLEDYLETKRIAFPRFYFLSNDELLSILSDVRNPQSVQPHLPKCFDSIASLIFANDACTEITGMRSGEGEVVTFASSVYPVGSVEQWLNEIEAMMKESLLMHMRQTIEAYPNKVREQWFFEHPAQCIQAADMIMWTGEVENAIDTKSLPNYARDYQKQILKMVDLVKGKLSKLERSLVCTLIVLNVHNRDIIGTLAEHHVQSLGDFNWSQQLRYYWEADKTVTGGMNVGIQHCSAHLWYGYEYLGNQPRLVITPLTDRAFLTCTSALGMHLGAAPQGPAGTGKTESVKDLGKALARQVVVFNCSDGINYKTMSRMFAGLAQAGAWACFDEFNRIELEVLSVIAQQMMEITTALGQKQDRMNFDGHPIHLSKNFGVFITMNPGYAGRTELPDNLKALFRPICMMIPDYALIAEIMFYSEGFADARTLARKMVQLYKLSSEQLSKQDHYDFGMRAVKSILVMAGSLKRQHPNESEDVLLIRAMQDANVPKFLRDDTILFMALVRDLFPTVAIANNQNELIFSYMKKEMEAHSLQIVDGMVTKALQLYDTLVVRHGVMMVGQTFSGKTTTVNTLRATLTQIAADGHGADGNTPLFNRVQTHLLNPKSVTMGELYGQVNDITREWTDGILSDIARNITRTALSSADRQWVIFDGPVDAIWIENMNTVLDDNKLLCLFNGERIKLPATATFMFEVQDLRVASPATVSRCGMVFMEPYYLDGNRGWVPIAQTLVGQKAAQNNLVPNDRLMKLLDALLPDTLDFIRKECREWVPSVDAQLAVNLIELIDAFMRSTREEEEGASDMWPVEALLPIEEELRTKKGAGKGGDDDMAMLGTEEKTVDAYEPPEEFRSAAITAPTVAANKDRLFDMYFVMAFVWTLGGNLRDDTRAAFDHFVRQLLPKVAPELPPLPAGGSVYDLVVHRPSLSFITWNHLVPNFVYDRDVPYVDLVVPTAETVALKTLLGVLASTSRHVLVNGVTGTGKSLGLFDFLTNSLKGDDPSGKWEYFTTVLSAQTRSRDIEERLDAKLYKLRSTAIGPTPGKRAIFFVDDLNMPSLEKYGASPPLELLRQLITQGGFFDKHKTPATFKELHDVTLLAACGVPGGGRNEMTQRLTSRFHLICQPAVSEASSRRIFGSILYGFFRQWNAEDMTSISMKLVEATQECYDRITREKLPTPTRSHYTFNLRDFSKVIQGIMQVTPQSAPTRDDLCHVFMHEVSRTFHDRLIDEDDRTWWWSTLGTVASEKLGIAWEDTNRDMLFGDFMRRDRSQYERLPELEQLQQALQEHLNGFNMEYNKETQLVFFKDAVHHVSRICRILRQPRGHALLVGMGGSGRQSVCRLAAFMCELPIFEITITRTFSMTEFHDSLKNILLESGCKNKHVLFLLSDTQIVYEEMLEDINNLLNTGEIPNLMQTEDMDRIVESVRPLAAAAGKQETMNVIFSHFVSLCRSNVHLVLSMSPVGDQFRRRLRMFPSLVNCCTIDWFDQWPSDALHSVAERILGPVEIVDESVKPAIIELCVDIHLDVQRSSEEFYEELRRRNYTTPTSYLELLQCYCSLLQEQSKYVTAQINRYQGGLNTLRSTQVMVDEMKASLVEMQPKLLEAAKNTEEIMAKVEEEQNAASVVQKQCAEEEAIASGIQAEADGIRAECQVELDKALPILKAAQDALAELRPDDIREVRSFQKPASRVVLVLEAVLTLLGEKDVGWDRAKLVMSRMDFIKDLQNYPRDDLTEKMVKSIQKYVTNPEFQPEEVVKSSKACRSLSMWVLAINNYYEVTKVIGPKRERLAEAEGKVAIATKALHDAQERLNEIEAKLSALRREMEENIQKKKQLEDDIDLTTVRLERAEQLMSGLASEQTRWVQSVASLQEEKGGLVGRIVLAAGFVAYLGPFTAPYRERLIRRWYDRCLELQIPVGKHEFKLPSVADPVLVRSWAQHGLPPDAFSVENGIIVNKSKRWCLCVDPQGQAVNWIRNMERENNLRVIKLSDANYMRTLENAIRLGLPVLLENVEESLDAALDSVLLRQTYRSQGRLLLKLGDTEVDYDPNFRFYITTKLPNPTYLPELQIKVTIVNFTVTQSGLENQLLADVVRYEYAELEQRADKTVLDIASGKNELKQLEDKILQLLASSTGNILDNEQLVNTLQGAKRTSESVSEAVRVAEETQKDIEAARNRYRPVATRGSIVYSVVSELSGLDHMYQNSLDFFKVLFTQTLQRTEKKEDVDERVAVLLPAVTLSSYQTICRGLFERDKLIFAFLLYASISRQEGTIGENEWSFMLKGSEGHKYADPDSDPAPQWLPFLSWNEATALSQLVPELQQLHDNIYDRESEWKDWYESDKAYEDFPALLDNMTLWQKLLVLKAMREDLLSYGMPQVITQSLGKEFTESPTFDLEGCFIDSTPTAPIVFVLTTGTDPTQMFTEFAARKGFGSRKLMLSLGQDQGTKAEEMIRRGTTEGMWVYLQNCHVYTSWIPSLERILEELGRKDVHKDFRLWLTTMPVAAFPVLLLQSCVKVVKEPPKGLKANLRDTLAMNVTDAVWDSCPGNPVVWRRLILSLTYFHAVVQERRRFGPLGWNIAYEWNQSDYYASLQSLTTYIDSNSAAAVPWDALRYMVGVINYGGRVTDFLDNRCLDTILTGFFNDKVTQAEQFNITKDGVYNIPAHVESLSKIKTDLAALPPFEGPELFGLNANADIAFNKSNARRQLAAMRSMQPRSKGAVGRTPEEHVLSIATEFEHRLPPLIDKSKAHPDTYRLKPDGTMISLGTVAGQEIDVFNRILEMLRHMLVELRRGIKGEVVMSMELEAMFNSFLQGEVPESWAQGSYLSRKPLASWFEDTLARVEFFRDWNDNGLPLSFWISGFFFPQGFLTGVLQTYCRDNQVPIDDVKFKTNLTTFEVPDDITTEHLHAGVYIHGLYLEGAGFDLHGKHLIESRKGELFAKMPVIHLEPVRLDATTATAETYKCPVYKTSARVGTLSTTGLSTNFVISLDLASGTAGTPEHWIKCGVALLCMLDD